MWKEECVNGNSGPHTTVIISEGNNIPESKHTVLSSYSQACTTKRTSNFQREISTLRVFRKEQQQNVLLTVILVLD